MQWLNGIVNSAPVKLLENQATLLVACIMLFYELQLYICFVHQLCGMLGLVAAD